MNVVLGISRFVPSLDFLSILPSVLYENYSVQSYFSVTSLTLNWFDHLTRQQNCWCKLVRGEKLWWPNTTLLICTRFSSFFFPFSSPRPTLLSLYHYTLFNHANHPSSFPFCLPWRIPSMALKTFPSIFFFPSFFICFPCWILFVSLRRKQGENISSLNEMEIFVSVSQKIPIPNGWNYLKNFVFCFQLFSCMIINYSSLWFFFLLLLLGKCGVSKKNFIRSNKCFLHRFVMSFSLSAGLSIRSLSSLTTKKKQMQSNAYQNKRASYIQTNDHEQREEPNVT